MPHILNGISGILGSADLQRVYTTNDNVIGKDFLTELNVSDATTF